MKPRFVMSLDQGTSGSTCIVFDEHFQTVGRAYHEVACHYPQQGWVSQDPEELWTASLITMRRALKNAGIEAGEVAALGITNQRETTIVWEKATGKPVHEAIVWQCRRTAPLVEEYAARGLGEMVAERTGLLLDAYFSASKIAWILKSHPEIRPAAERGELLFGTVDTWLLWNMTGGATHATEPSNAARTMLYNIHTMEWDAELLSAFDIPRAMLPEVKSTVGPFGKLDKQWLGAEIPILGIAGDQQAALFGHACFNPGDVKNTYGTGCFLVMNVGEKPINSKHKLLTTVAWQIDGRVNYALEGSVFSAGSAVQWLRDSLGVIKNSAETEALALSLPDNEGVYFVPAFSGLGAPHWDPYALGAVYGLTRGAGCAHLARAVLEAAAYQTCEVLKAMQEDCRASMSSLRVDGGMSANNFLMQFQADMLNLPVERPLVIEATAKGAASLAGMGAGLCDWRSLEESQAIERVFRPSLDEARRLRYLGEWQEAIRRTLSGRR